MGGIGIILGFAIAIMVGVYLYPQWQSQLTIITHCNTSYWYY